jgi:hypothetical protein
MRYYHPIVQQGGSRQGNQEKFWWWVAIAVVAGLIIWGATVEIPSLFHHSSPPSAASSSSSSSSVSGSPSQPARSASAASSPSWSAPKFLMSLPVASGDMPQKGLVTIGGQSFSKSLYYDNSTRVQTGYNTDFNLAGHWKRFVAWVGIQPDPSDFMGSCTRDAGSTYQVLVNQNRVKQGTVSCEPEKISVSVAGAHELDLIFNTHPFYIATGEFAWANAKLQ